MILNSLKTLSFLVLSTLVGVLASLPATAQGTLFVENDRVGVGIGTPTDTLHVYGDQATTKLVVEEDSAIASARTLFTLRNNGGIRFAMVQPNNAIWQFNALANFNIDFNGNPGNELQVRSNGDVAIGGTLISNALTFPDYVFEDTYPLMPLADLDAFIGQNKHLPNIPSAAQVQEAGTINMTEMQVRLLEKVEELTLYTIAQQEHIDALTARLQALEAQVQTGSNAAE